MPVKFTENPQEWTSNQDKYVIKDKNGKVITTTPTISDEVKNAMKEGKGLVYSEKDGLKVGSATPAGITYDTNTGKIKISAPKSVLESEWFKKAYTENNTFRQAATLFKNNPNDKTGYSFYDERGNVTEKTIEDYIKEQAKAFDEYYKDFMDYVVPRQQELSHLAGGQKFSEDQAITSYGAVSKEKNKYSENVAVKLPQLALTVAPELKKFDSWNEDTKSVNAKDFYEWYKLGDGRDEKIDTLNATVQEQIVMLASRDDLTEYDKEQLVRLIAFNNTLNADRPDATFFQGLWYGTRAALSSFAKNLSKSSVNLVSFLETASAVVGEVTNINTTSGKILGVLTGGTSIITGATATANAVAIQGLAVVGDDIGDAIAGIDNNSEEAANTRALIGFGDIMKGFSEGRVRETLEVWAKQTDTPLNSEAVSELDRIYSEKIDSLEKLSGAVSVGKFVGNLAAEIVKQIVLTNVVGKAVGGAVNSAIDKAAASYYLPGYMAEITNYAVAAEALENGIGAYLASMETLQLTQTFISATEAATSALSFVGFTTNVLSQGIVDTVLNDEDSLERILTEGDTGPAFSAVLKNSTYNLFGEMTGFGTSKAWTAFKKTKAGHTFQVASWRVANKVAGKKHTILAEFADWMAEGNGRAARALDKIFGASDETSRWYGQLHWREAEAAYNVASAAKGLSGEEAFEATQKAVIQRMQLEIEMGNVTRGIVRRYNEIISNEAIAKEYQEFTDEYANLLKKEGARAVKLGEGTYLSQDTSNYIARLSKIQYLTNKGGESLANLSKTEADYLSMLQTRVVKFEAEHPELIDAAKSFLQKYQAYEKAYMDLAVKSYDAGGLGLYERDVVRGWRQTGYWGEDGGQYVPLVRINADEGSLSAAKRSLADWESGGNYRAKLSVDEYSYKPGDADADYLDPSLTVYTQQVTAAKVSLSRDWGDVLMKNDALAVEIDTSGKYVTKPDIVHAKANVKRVVNKTMDSFDIDDTILNYKLSNTYKVGTDASVTKARKKMLRVLGLSKPEAYERAAYNLTLSDMDNLRALGVDIPVIDEAGSDAELKVILDKLPRGGKKIVKQAVGTSSVTVDSFNKALKETDLQLQLQQAYVTKGLYPRMFNEKYRSYIEGLKEKALTTKGATRLAEATEEYNAALKQMKLREVGKDDFTKEVSRLMEDMIGQSEENLSRTAFFKESVKKYTDLGVPESVAKRYLVATEYKDFFTSSRSKNFLNKMIDKNLNSLEVSGNLTTQARLAYRKAIKKAMKEMAESEWTDSLNAMKKAGGGSLVDTNEVYNYIYEQMSDFIDTTLKSPNVIQVLDENGVFHLYKVSPATADLYKFRPNVAEYKQRGLIKFFNKTNRLARLGNVGYSLRSFTNQWMRDPLNAYVMGGMVRSLGKNAEAFGELLGPDVVEFMQEAMGEAGWKSFTEDLAESLGREASQEELETAAKEIVSNTKYMEDMATEALGGTQTEMAYYRERATGARDAIWNKFEEDRGVMAKTLEKLEKHSIGEIRETYLRKAVFAQSYNDALELGHTAQEAKIIAEYTMQNATTNFSRSFAWGNNITQSVSFLGAAINGRASFWRLLEVDPLGISMRFTVGLALPTMALVAQSLENEDDKKLYESIPEYEKQDNIVFVVDGQKMKIPIPQELSAFIAPFRQVVEKANNANKHTWAELVANDVLGTSAIDLTGLVDLDANLLGGDVDLADRLSEEGQTLIAQLSPTIVKTAYMALTGIDPYTGNPINKEKTYLDESGQEQIYDSKTSAFTTWLSTTLKSMGVELSGSSAHALMQSMLGNGFTNVIDAVYDLFSEGGIEGALEKPLSEITAAFESTSAEDQAEFAWNEEYKKLQKKKDELLANGGKLNKVATRLNSLDTSKSDYEMTRKNLLKEYYSITQEYQQEVYTAVKNLQSKYGGDYDREKFASTINLLTFYTSLGDGLTEYEKKLDKNMRSAARQRALRTMSEMGFDSPHDLSIFGYLWTNEYGEAQARTYSPVAIMTQGNQIWGAKDVDAANIEVALEQNNLTRKEMFGDAYKKAKASGKAALKKYKSEWNTKVIKVLAPYVASRGLDSVLNSFDTRDLLDNYIFVDNPYKTEEYLYKIFGGK